MKVILVSMPWASLDRPSLALSALAPAANEGNADVDVEIYYANISWAEWLMRLDPPVAEPAELAVIDSLRHRGRAGVPDTSFAKELIDEGLALPLGGDEVVWLPTRSRRHPIVWPI